MEGAPLSQSAPDLRIAPTRNRFTQPSGALVSGMNAHVEHANCDHAHLRTMLEEALVQADRCDPIVAIHIVTALELLDERFPPSS